MVFNDRGELLDLALTPGNVDDRKPIPKIVKEMFGKMIVEKGYVSQPLFELLLKSFNIQLITKLRSTMKIRLMPLADHLLLGKRSIIETIIDQPRKSFLGLDELLPCQFQLNSRYLEYYTGRL